MHELHICLSLLRSIEKQERVQRIKTIWLEIGELAGIELEALRFSFPIAAKRSIAEDATLNITSLPGQAWCDDCQNSVTIKAHFNPCPQCQRYNYRITQGKELRIIKMEVE